MKSSNYEIHEDPQNELEQGESRDKVDMARDGFSGIIQSITEAYSREWTREKLELAQNFLSRTWSGIPLPILSICGRGTQEIRYSKYLGYFLDGSKSHGIGSRFLDELLNMVMDNEIDTSQAYVETEKWIGKAKTQDGYVNCICDNVITCKNFVVFIEQKIKSGESNSIDRDSQLRRYDEAISTNEEYLDRKHIKIYLTISGRESVRSPNWHPVSHQTLIQAGLNVMHKGGISSVARDNLKRLLLDLLLGPIEKSEELLQSLVESAKAAVLTNDFSERLRFDRVISQNEMLVKILMEG